MTTTQQVVVGVFDDHTQAEQAVNALLNSGFTSDQIRYSGHGVAPGGMLATLKIGAEETILLSQEDADDYFGPCTA